ncbi:MAG: quinol monooxygenase YgiN [Cyclobacteriaceae bacterium]|jgi:quinol monooxygenase YgiN
MEFITTDIEAFMLLFEKAKPTILKQVGCHAVILYRDSQQPEVFYTHSLWENEKALNAYRDSDFFSETWANTKKLFSGKPQAFSLIEP